MSEEAHLHLIIAAFDKKTGAEEALKSLKGSQDEELIGVQTGGTGIALGALGALVGGLAGRRKRDSRFPAERVNQLAAALAPDSSAALIVMEPGWAFVLQEKLGLLGAEVLAADIPAGVAEGSTAEREAAYAALVEELKHAK